MPYIKQKPERRHRTHHGLRQPAETEPTTTRTVTNELSTDLYVAMVGCCIA